MLLGLRTDDGVVVVGGAAAFTTDRRVGTAGAAVAAAHRRGERQGEKNRWNAREDDSWVPVRQELVCEVEYDQLEG